MREFGKRIKVTLEGTIIHGSGAESPSRSGTGSVLRKKGKGMLVNGKMVREVELLLVCGE